MDISDPVVVEGMQNMQIHQSGKRDFQISKKIFENKSYLCDWRNAKIVLRKRHVSH